MHFFGISSISHTSLTASAWPRWKPHQKGDLISTETDHVDERTSWLEGSQVGSGPVFTTCGNSINFSSTDGSMKLTFTFSLLTSEFWFLEKSQIIFLKKWIYTSVGQSPKKKFWLWQHIKFFLIYGQLTFMLHYRIHSSLTDGILNSEVASKFSLYLITKTIIWKVVVAPFASSMSLEISFKGYL